MSAEGSSFVFILGTGRCGSTLVHELIGRHPDAGFVSNVENRFRLPGGVGRWNSAAYRLVPLRLRRTRRVRFAPSEAYRLLNERVSPAVVDPVRDLRETDATPWLGNRFRRFFEDRARAQGKPVFLHKFTGWPRAGFIHAVFPEARFVNVIRDGRAVANSFLQMPWWSGFRGPDEWRWGPLPEAYTREWEASGRSFVLLAGLEWKLLMDAFEEAKSAVPGELWMDVRYEDLVSDPREMTAEVLRFAGLEWTRGFERGFERQSFEAGRVDAYRTDLSEADVALLDVSLADHLARLGYATRPGTLAEAAT